MNMNKKKISIWDGRLHLGAAIVFLLLAMVDLSVQGRKYDFDLQSLSYLSPLGWVFFILMLLFFTVFIGSFVVEAIKQMKWKRKRKE